MEKSDVAIISGVIGAVISGLVVSKIADKKINKLEKDNREWEALYGQMVDEIRNDLGNDELTGYDRWIRLKDRLNFITTVKAR